MKTPFKQDIKEIITEKFNEGIDSLERHRKYGTSLRSVPGFEGYRIYGTQNPVVKDKYGKTSYWRTYLAKDYLEGGITKKIHKTIEKHPIYSGLPLLKHTYKMFKR